MSGGFHFFSRLENELYFLFSVSFSQPGKSRPTVVRRIDKPPNVYWEVSGVSRLPVFVIHDDPLRSPWLILTIDDTMIYIS